LFIIFSKKLDTTQNSTQTKTGLGSKPEKEEKQIGFDLRNVHSNVNLAISEKCVNFEKKSLTIFPRTIS